MPQKARQTSRFVKPRPMRRGRTKVSCFTPSSSCCTHCTPFSVQYLASAAYAQLHDASALGCDCCAASAQWEASEHECVDLQMVTSATRTPFHHLPHTRPQTPPASLRTRALAMPTHSAHGAAVQLLGLAASQLTRPSACLNRSSTVPRISESERAYERSKVVAALCASRGRL